MTTIQGTASTQGRRREASAGSTSTLGHRPAQRAPELAPLALEDLRAYRQELITEESRISYWRRILQARLDLALGDESSLGRLRRVGAPPPAGGGGGGRRELGAPPRAP
ncbi:MAG: hypothetical protein LH461_05110, partial [Spirochaetaceae bacterium]|nr:hypothetical protein [Spirochaetaceae bacterium]